jgi:hypothetical protein
MFKSLSISILLYFTLFSPYYNQSTRACQKVEGLTNPVNIFHIYFQQIITMLDPKNEASQAWLIFYREQNDQGNYHHFVFRVKYKFRNKFSYIGLVSFVPEKEFDNKKFTHYLVRYIDSARIDDVISLLGIYDLKKQDPNAVINCSRVKENALANLLKSQIPNKCRANEVKGCVNSNDLTKIFQANFQFIQNALNDFKFKVNIGQLGFNKTILKIYRESFPRFEFVSKAVKQLEDLINDENEVDHDQLVIDSDMRKKPVCEDILDMTELCKKEKLKGKECLSEKEARSLINYMIIHYMADTKTVLPTKIFDGKL